MKNDDLMDRVLGGRLTRRSLLLSLPAMAAARQLMAQAPPAPLRVLGLHQVSLAVTDVQRSLKFYQDIFGMPVQARQGATVLLRIGAGPQFLSLTPVAAGESPRIDHLGLKVENFNADRVVQTLAAHGITRADGAGGGLSGGPLKVRVTTRGATPEVFMGDPDGIVIQLQDPTYCGGGGPLGATCGAPEAAPSRGLFPSNDLSHFTIQATDAARANEFYQRVFGLGIQAYQATTPALAVGPGVHFLMFTGGAGGGRGRGNADAPPPPPRPARIDHVCLNMPAFKPEEITKALEGYGITPRAAGQTGPMQWWISMRLPNRGGFEPDGTPELYFSDPDGLSIQLQDVSYCGGGGYLGDVCPG